jgi:methyl-accepting chemotaxis protein
MSILITGVYTYLKGSQVIVDQSKDNMVTLSQSLTDTMTETLVREELSVAELTHRQNIKDYFDAASSLDSRADVKKNYYLNKITQDLAEYKSNKAFIDDIFILANDGIVIAGDSSRLVGKAAPSVKQLIASSDILYDAAVNSFIEKQDVVFSAPIVISDCVFGYIVVGVNIDKLSGYLANYSVNHHAGNYAFVVDKNGDILSHPDKSRIGTAINNKAISQRILELDSSDHSPSGTLTWKEEGKSFIAAYSLVKKTGWTIFVKASRQDISAPAGDMSRSIIFIGLLVALLSVLGGLYTAKQVTNPIHKVTKLINKAAQLDLTQHDEYRYLTQGKDETGTIAISIFEMLDSLKSMILRLSSASSLMMGNASLIINAVDSTKPKIHITSDKSKEIADGMKEMSSAAEEVSAVAESLNSSLKIIESEIKEGTKVSNLITEKAQTIKSNSVYARKNAAEIYDEVKDSMKGSMDSTKEAVKEIVSFTEVIKNIAAQTKMLSLNASIEAARAGEAGKGFSVVAGEIRTLSDRAAGAVSDISHMVQYINTSSRDLFKSAQKLLEYIDNQVNRDYDEMINISDQYKTDAVTVSAIMNKLNSTINAFSESLGNISYSISETSATAAMNTIEIATIALQTDEINREAESIQAATWENMNHIIEIRKLVENFKL